MDQDTEPMRPQRTKPHLGWVSGIAAVGIGMLACTLGTAGSGVVGVWQSIGVNVGTALVLAALLVFIEPRFRTRIAEAAAKSAEAKYETRVDALTERVDNLQESTRELFEHYAATEDEAVNDMVTRPSFYTVASALVEANKGYAIDRVLGVTVPAALGIPDVLIRFRYVSPTGGRTGDHSRDFLDVSPKVLLPPPNGHLWPSEGQWRSAENADQVGARLMKELQAAGLKNVETKLDWKGTIDRLGKALDLAFESKRTDGKVDGHVIEMGPGGWFLTSSGIEHLEHGVVVEGKEFPSKFEMLLGLTGAMAAGKELQEYEAGLKRLEKEPGWADPAEWQYVLGRARDIFPGFNEKRGKIPPAIASTVPPKRPEPKRPAPPVVR